MREVGGESKNAHLTQPNISQHITQPIISWLSNGKYHLQQLGKGALVAGMPCHFRHYF